MFPPMTPITVSSPPNPLRISNRPPLSFPSLREIICFISFIQFFGIHPLVSPFPFLSLAPQKEVHFILVVHSSSCLESYSPPSSLTRCVVELDFFIRNFFPSGQRGCQRFNACHARRSTPPSISHNAVSLFLPSKRPNLSMSPAGFDFNLDFSMFQTFPRWFFFGFGYRHRLFHPPPSPILKRLPDPTTSSCLSSPQSFLNFADPCFRSIGPILRNR